MIDYLICM